VGKLYIFGDSYSTPDFCVEIEHSWWGLMARDLSSQIEGVDNFSWPGNNIDSIQHIIVANKDMFRRDDTLMIGVPPLERLTVFEHDAREKQVMRFDAFLQEVSRSLVPRHSGLKQITRYQASRDLVELWNRSWQEAQILRQLVTLAAWLDTVVDRWIIVNLSEPFQPLTQWSTLSSLQQQTMTDDRMILFQDTYYSCNHEINKPVDFDTHGWHGHHGAEGNQKWYREILAPRLKRLAWT
jgi:hypothetical protein